MRNSKITRRIQDISESLKSARSELAVTDEQLILLGDQRDDAKTRAIVSETPIANREYREAERSYTRQQRYRDSLAKRIDDLAGSRDELLDKLAALGE